MYQDTPDEGHSAPHEEAGDYRDEGQLTVGLEKA
jgi:hypothetical protein